MRILHLCKTSNIRRTYHSIHHSIHPVYTHITITSQQATVKIPDMARFYVASAIIFTSMAMASDAFITSSVPRKITISGQLQKDIDASPSWPANRKHVTRPSTMLSADAIKEDVNNKAGPTLYEILNSEPNATRQELKRNFVTLAKQSHPDALVSNGSSSSTESDEQFQLASAAWKTLSNPLERKRYDRELRAQAFTQNVEDIVGNIATTAGPQFMKAFDNVAIPFLRRSAATTVAGFTAVTQDIQNYGEVKKSGRELDERVNGTSTSSGTRDTAKSKNVETLGLGSILSNAVQASQKASKAIDRMELSEKSDDLVRRARQDRREANRLRDKLDLVIRTRVQLMLHTPDVKLTSLESMIILDGFNIKDEVTMLDTVRLRKTVKQEIEFLEPLEKEYEDKKQLDKKYDADIERKSLALERAEVNAEAALQAEERARKALEDAIALVQSTKVDVDDASSSLRVFAEEKKFNLSEIDRYKWGMERQQERVRLALRRKEQVLQKTTNSNILVPVDQEDDLNSQDEMEIIEDDLVGDFNAEKAAAAQDQIKELLVKEKFLKAESKRLEAKAERSQSRAKRLNQRANELEEEEEEVYKVIEEGLRAAIATDSGFGES